MTNNPRPDYLQNYFRANVHEVTPTEEMFRTEGSSQLVFWGEMPSNRKAYDWREYHRGIYMGQPCFVKRILKVNKEYLPIDKFIKDQASRLLSLQQYPFIPRLLFYTPNALVTSFCEGKTIKQLWYDDRLDIRFLENFIPPVVNAINLIRNTLAMEGEIYDLSLNNLIVDIQDADSEKENTFHFVDFDKTVNYSPLTQFLLQLIVLAQGKWGYDKNGKLEVLQKREVDKS